MQEKIQTAGGSLLPFSPLTILTDVLHRWYLIAAAVLLVGMGARVGLELTYVPRYTAVTTFVVTGRSSSLTAYQDLSKASELAGVFTHVLNSTILRDTVLEELDMDSFDGTITAAAVGKTNLLTMKITASDPRTAFLVSKAVIAHHHIVSGRVLGDVALDVLQSPKVPVSPANGRDTLSSTAWKVAVLAGAATAGLLGFLSYSRDTVRSRQEAEEKLDCHYLGEVLHERRYKTLKSFLAHKKSSVLMTQPDASFHFAESIQKIRRRIEHHLTPEKKVVLITSVMENEGKSTMAANLALSFTLAGRKALLIDCDLRKPTCRTIMQYPDFTNGTAAVLQGRISLASAIRQDPVTGLSMLLEKEVSDNAAELIISQGMKQLLIQARKDFDVVLLDMPPMSAAPDAEAAAGLADGIVMVVRQNIATAEQINHAVTGLRNTGGPVLGFVLNNMLSSELTHSSTYGYSGYGHYGKYGKYGTYGNTPSRSHRTKL